MIRNPFPIPSTSALVWANGFFNGLSGPNQSVDPPDDVAEEDVNAFSAGVLAGQDSAIHGWDLFKPCVAAAEEPSEVGHVMTGVEVLHGFWELRQLATLAAGLAGLAVAAVELACTLPKHVLPSEQVLPGLMQPLMDSLAAFGVGSLELFCGAASDPSQKDCEIRLTPFFKSAEQAKAAAIEMRRPQWAVFSWRSDIPDSFGMVEAS